MADIEMRQRTTNCTAAVSVEPDIDAATDEMLFRDNITWSKGRLKRAKIVSMFTGNNPPSRRKIFSEIRSSEDITVWNIMLHGKSIRCAKVNNPTVLTKQATTAWTELSGVQRLEIEDPEGMLRTIPKQLFNDLRHLQSLSITWTKIRSLPTALYHLPLHSLYLQRNLIKTISGVDNATQLTILDISNNELSSLPKSFGQLQNLVTLNVSGNSLQELPDSIGLLTSLKSLDCSCNKLKAMPSSINMVIGLTSLDFSSNRLASLPDAIGCLPNLEDLRLTNNQLSTLPDSFSELLRLNSLLLRGNKFEAVPAQLSNLTNLQSLNMRENKIHHMDQPISSLKFLILDFNEIAQIDVGILQCSNLQQLVLCHNKLVEVTGGISKLTGLRSLNLSENDITEVPTELSRLQHLRRLSLCYTRIHTIPLAVASMPGLKTLEMEECNSLDPYLKIAYKTNGLPGVIDHLTSAVPITSSPLQHNEDESLMPKKESTSSNEVSKRLIVRPRSDGGKERETMMPSDENTELLRDGSGKSRDLRQMAGLSIVPGTSVKPPSPEAIQSNNGSQLVHVARQSICPPPRTSRTTTQPRQYRNTQMSPESSLNVIPESSPPPSSNTPQTVVQSLPDFGDLVTSTTIDSGQKESGRTAEVDDDDDLTNLHAVVTKKRSSISATAPGSKAPPPVKPKPSFKLSKD